MLLIVHSFLPLFIQAFFPFVLLGFSLGGGDVQLWCLIYSLFMFFSVKIVRNTIYLQKRRVILYLNTYIQQRNPQRRDDTYVSNQPMQVAVSKYLQPEAVISAHHYACRD